MGMSTDLEQMLAVIDFATEENQLPPRDWEASIAWIQSAETDDLIPLLEAFTIRPAPQTPVAQNLVATVLQQLAWRAGSRADNNDTLPPQHLAALYRHWHGADATRVWLLRCLALQYDHNSLTTFAELLVSDPPVDAATALTPLFQSKNYDPAALFPRLLDGLSYTSLAVLILDLANYTVREELLDQHPAEDRQSELTQLLGGLVRELEQLEQKPQAAATRPNDAERVSESVSLAVSLCDALALIGSTSAISQLYQALELRHRRLRLEAAASLIRLGEDEAQQALIQLAGEPVVRLRALAYAQELGLVDQIDEKYKTPIAEAEAEVAWWLAQPTQMGIPPTTCELVDSRTQHWPGYDAPMPCFLFRFTYQFGNSQYSNVAIAGPLTHAFATSFCDLSAEDAYAGFAGWHVDHEEIYEVEIDPANPTPTVTEYVGRIERDGYEVLTPSLLGYFLGEQTLVAKAVRDGEPGYVLLENTDIYWRPQGPDDPQLLAVDAYGIHKGHKLLRAFN